MWQMLRAAVRGELGFAVKHTSGEAELIAVGSLWEVANTKAVEQTAEGDDYCDSG